MAQKDIHGVRHWKNVIDVRLNEIKPNVQGNELSRTNQKLIFWSIFKEQTSMQNITKYIWVEL